MFALLRQFMGLEMVDPYSSWNEGAWQMTPFNGEGVNNNAANPNYQTTGSYSQYPGHLPACAPDGSVSPCFADY
jgi:hypothetical protein